jgi:hypothetical protein
MDDLLGALEGFKPHSSWAQRALSKVTYPALSSSDNPPLPPSGNPLTYRRPFARSVKESLSLVLENNLRGDSASKDKGKEKATANLEPDNNPSSYTQPQREAINRILKCHDKDYYRILNLPKTCGKDDIKARFKELSLITHPDKNKF